VHLVSLLPQLEGLIVPSKFYGILAAARPVVFIGHPDGELARVIGDAGIGAVVEVGDASALARQLAGLNRDSPRREAMGAAAHRYYRDHYTAQRALDRWIEILQPPSKEHALTPGALARDA